MPEISRVSSNLSAPNLPVFDDWQAVSLLGRGRWSRVYRARPCSGPDSAHADYAVKVADSQTDDQAALARQLLVREASLSRAVAHPNLTCILTSHLRQSPYYLVMPFIEGITLEDHLLHSRGLTVPETLWIARQTLDAIRELHRIDWIHGDIKPANLHLSTDGHVTILDLGLARRIGDVNDSATLTGTLEYLAPEAFSSVGQLGPSCDIYSLGVTLYRMLTSKLPFESKDAAELAEAHLHQSPPDPRQYVPSLPLPVVRLVQQMLAKQAAQRPTPDNLVNELMRLEITTFAQRSAA